MSFISVTFTHQSYPASVCDSKTPQFFLIQTRLALSQLSFSGFLDMNSFFLLLIDSLHKSGEINYNKARIAIPLALLHSIQIILKNYDRPTSLPSHGVKELCLFHRTFDKTNFSFIYNYGQIPFSYIEVERLQTLTYFVPLVLSYAKQDIWSPV